MTLDDSTLLRRATDGDQTAIGDLLDRYRARLQRMVAVRLDPRLRKRLDPADVVQSAYVEVLKRLQKYLMNPTMPFFSWLRFITGQEITAVARQHLGVAARDARREAEFRHGIPGVSSVITAERLLQTVTTPSKLAVRAEDRRLVEAALQAMDGIDREVLVLRHFEQFTNAEVAQELGIGQSAATKRYLRALQRIEPLLKSVGEGRSARS